ncbi:MAG: amino acid permease, partial [Cyclobacteriaceae bacterium]|nr:amino acid permease [Cyclobacteriaceae bacterium]
SFIGFDSIAQAGSEAKNPHRNLPLAIAITIISVGGFYLLFTSAVYHTVPWYYVAEQAAGQDITAPGLLSPLLSPTLAALIILGAAIALLNDLPAMLLSVSRLMFAWAQDAIFPRKCAAVHPKYHTPHMALVFSGMAASLGILGSHFAGDFFLGVDIMVTSMLVNFLLMCLTLGMIHKVNPTISEGITFVKNLRLRRVISILGVIFLLLFLAIHLYKDLGSDMPWYFKSTPIWILVMTAGSAIYLMAPKNKKGSSDINSGIDQTPNQSVT